ncbi:hypothetical protein AK88_02766 [Plasmodium fragile]|uniref:GPI transamidase component PIG-S n=1 Tax=Plasmodium fragile TaxID=5857 RepID=A0A0D9QKY1_PLAFR|nr:uncharacterized protein AK88_02766 [Plasmodium fragile]KJP87598.1 hypothetical protein AK88_02766 [Plasmodium fragile]
MNSRTPCVIVYAVSLVVCVLVIFSLNKYERQGVPLHKLSSTSAYVQDIYNAGIRENVKGGRQNWSHDKVSHLSIKLFIVLTSGGGNSDSLGRKMKEYFSNQIEVEYKDKPVAQSISDIQELFCIHPLVISEEEMKSDDMRELASVCLSDSPEKGATHNLLSNRYFLCLSEKQEENETSVVFRLKRNNTIHMKFSPQVGNSTTYHERLAEEAWRVLKRVFFFKPKNRSLFFSPELDLNFYLASSLYNGQNYKMENYTTRHGGRNKTGDDQNIYASHMEGSSPSPVYIATWDFYTQVYYPYLRNFVEELLNVFQINVYTQMIANMDLFKISNKGKDVGGKRVVILNKVNKLSSMFDDVTLGDVLTKPTYHIPKSINLMAVFPCGDEIFFYNPATGKLETTVSFAEWGVVHVNNALQRGNIVEKRGGGNKKNRYVNVGEEAPIISGFFISHLRQYLGLEANFSNYVYTIFDADTYYIKYVRSESTDEGNSLLYSITSEDKIRFDFIYESPARSGIFPFELLALMREAYIHYVVEALTNLNKFVSISNVSMYFRVPEYALHVFTDVVEKVKCSLDLMRGVDGCKISHVGKSLRDVLKSYGGVTGGSTQEGDNRREETARLRDTYFRAAVVLAQSAYQDSLQLLSDDTFSIYDILSKDFLLASVLPILIPYAIPVTLSLFRELFRSVKLVKEKRKVD